MVYINRDDGQKNMTGMTEVGQKYTSGTVLDNVREMTDILTGMTEVDKK